MARVKISLPGSFQFSCRIPVRITDINYGGHVGNDTILTLVHEARMQFLQLLGFTEMNFGGKGMIMADAAIEFKSEVFYGDPVTVDVAVSAISRIGFDLVYQLSKEADGNRKIIAIVKTGMICYDYAMKKIVAIPENAREKISA